MQKMKALMAGLAMSAGLVSGASAITIDLDYTYDTNNFFGSNPSAQAALEQAAAVFETFTDDLSAIQPSGPNTWSAYFLSPATGNQETVNNLVVPADTLKIYVGGRDLPDSVLGQGGPGGYSISGYQNWLDTVRYRGETGAAATEPTDFGPWGGSITFDTAQSWHFDAAAKPSSGEIDFLSVAIHELAHVLGFGTADSWDTWLNGTFFEGPASVAEYGDLVPLYSGSSHWQTNTKSLVLGVEQETAMDPDLTVGTRKLFTNLDYAGMADIGWDVVIPIPEPISAVLLAVGGAVALGRRRRTA